jgi:hypothetical protein
VFEIAGVGRRDQFTRRIFAANNFLENIADVLADFGRHGENIARTIVIP